VSTDRVESAPAKERVGGTPKAFLVLALLVAALLRVPYFFERDSSVDLRQPTVDAGFHDVWPLAQRVRVAGVRRTTPIHTSTPRPTCGLRASPIYSQASTG
jgi:hypothetical protein